MAEIATVHEASRRVRELKTEEVPVCGKSVTVGFLTVDDFETFAQVLEEVSRASGDGAAGMSIIRRARTVVKKLVGLTCPALTDTEIGALPLLHLWDLLVVIADVNWQVDLNDFFTDGGAAHTLGRLLAVAEQMGLSTGQLDISSEPILSSTQD